MSAATRPGVRSRSRRSIGARLADTPDALADWLGPLVDRGVDVLDCSQRRFWEAEFPEIDGPDGLNLAGWAKKLTGAGTISVGSVGLAQDVLSSLGGQTSPPADLRRLIERMEKGEFGMIAVGRAILIDPRWVTRSGRAGTTICAASLHRHWPNWSEGRSLDPRSGNTLAPQSCDINVQANGIMYMSNWNGGLHVLQYDG
jgi:2,4-dienoyl-CoA reductase-like NADH-dependent reductase (Old Yellow Enzyme family)